MFFKETSFQLTNVNVVKDAFIISGRKQVRSQEVDEAVVSNSSVDQVIDGG